MKRLLPKGEFARNVLTLMTGATVAQAIPIAISPILTRLYTPQDLGVLALFIAITSIFGVVANARYEMALMLPESEDDALNVAALGLLFCTGLSLFLLVCVALFKAPIGRWLGNEAIGPWLYFVPLAVLFTGLFNVLNYYNNRLGRYGDIARANVLKALVMATVQLTAGLLKAGAGGLVSGQVLASLVANSKLLRNTLSVTNWRAAIKWSKMRALGARYKDFPRYSMPSVLLNTLSQQMAGILMSVLYSVATLGFYSLVQRVLGLPSALVGSAISQVFLQTGSRLKAKNESVAKVFDNTLVKLLCISVPVAVVAYLLLPKLFGFVFGSEWVIAGEYAAILLPLYVVRFVSSPLSSVLSIFEKQKQSLLINSLLTAQVGCCFALAKKMGLDVKDMLWLMSFSGSALYAVFIFYYRKVSRGDP